MKNYEHLELRAMLADRRDYKIENEIFIKFKNPYLIFHVANLRQFWLIECVSKNSNMYKITYRILKPNTFLVEGDIICETFLYQKVYYVVNKDNKNKLIIEYNKKLTLGNNTYDDLCTYYTSFVLNWEKVKHG